MKIFESQRLRLQTCHTQVQAEVSADAPSERFSSFPSQLAIGETLLFTNPRLHNDSALRWNMAEARTASRFKTHSATGIEAV
jgi:hypothetical protein